MDKVLLEIDNLTKFFRSYWTFRPIPAVHDVSLQVLPGEAFGFIGHNGAGKTTTIKSILGLLRINGGRIKFRGRDYVSSKDRAHLGYLPEQPYFYDHLTVAETMDFFSTLHGLKGAEKSKRIDKVLELLKLADRKKTPVRALSKGLQQRLGIAQAIVNRPELVLLDEPFSGLDPLGRMEIRDLILKLRAEGTAVFMSSHILSDVQDICDRVAIMAKGELRLTFPLKDAPKIFGESFELSVIEIGDGQKVLPYISHADSHTTRETSEGRSYLLRFKDYSKALEVLGQLTVAAVRIESFRRASLSLEDIFIKVTEGEAKNK